MKGIKETTIKIIFELRKGIHNLRGKMKQKFQKEIERIFNKLHFKLYKSNILTIN
jgi:hypothetical protein